jgi:hypothetical protein
VSDRSPPSSSDPGEPDLGEVFLEFYPIGATLKVSAIHAATGIEVSAVGPANAARHDLQRLALGKLRQRLKRDGVI